MKLTITQITPAAAAITIAVPGTLPGPVAATDLTVSGTTRLTGSRINVANLPASIDGTPPAGSQFGDLYVAGGCLCIAFAGLDVGNANNSGLLALL